VKAPRELRFGGVDLIHAGKRLVKEVGEDDISGAATELAYRLFLAMFPFFIFLAALGGFVADILDVTNPTEEIMDRIGDSLPPDTASILERELTTVIESQDLGLMSIGIVGAIWAASSGVGTITKTMNRIYAVKETRSRWKRYGLAVGVTLLGGGILIVVFLVQIVGQLYGLQLAAELGLEGAAAKAISLARWPIVIVFVLVALAFIYWAAPNAGMPFRWVTPGAVLATIGWLTMSLGFGFYVSNFSSYNATYGTLGGVVVTLVWFYLSSFVVLLGAEVNAVLTREADPEELQRPARGDTPASETPPTYQQQPR
jgi:membrane protein